MCLLCFHYLSYLPCTSCFSRSAVSIQLQQPVSLAALQLPQFRDTIPLLLLLLWEYRSRVRILFLCFVIVFATSPPLPSLFTFIPVLLITLYLQLTTH